jgi:chromosome segregation ATPase
MDVQGMVAAGSTAVGTGAVVLWFSKVMLQRLISQYDARHEAHEKRLEIVTGRVFDAISDVKSKLAAIEVRAAEISGMRADVQQSLARLAVLDSQRQKMQDDLNEAHKRIRNLRAAP